MFLLNFSITENDKIDANLQYKMFLLNEEQKTKEELKVQIYNTKCFY